MSRYFMVILFNRGLRCRCVRTYPVLRRVRAACASDRYFHFHRDSYLSSCSACIQVTVESYVPRIRIRSGNGHRLPCRVRFSRLRTVVTDVAGREDGIPTAREVCEFHRELRFIRRYGDVERPRPTVAVRVVRRSEERRVGKEGRSRWSPYH